MYKLSSYLICSYTLFQVILNIELFFPESGHLPKERKMTILLMKMKKLKKKTMTMKKKRVKKVVGRRKRQKRKRSRKMNPTTRQQVKNTLPLEILLLSKLGILHLR